ncbi:MAG TPA: L-threonylcarbamoyladenylate synthase [Burkholderiaceae bacterium]|nr:L-threonylcarbamoyladenylate synthase [Burkholderiaceae bacterium]
MIGPPVDVGAIGRAARLLVEGKLVAFPTETVYGLGADADNLQAVRAIFAAKGRPANHPVIVHVADLPAALAWAGDLPPAARTLADRFWPGPLTLVVARGSRAHDALTGAQRSVGLRCPSHPWAQALLRALCRQCDDPSRAIAAPSANRFGRISATRAEHVRADLGEKPHGLVDLILDGGSCPVGIESSIVDLTADRPRLLRPGSITQERIEQALGCAVDLAADDPDAPRAPGRLARHYAPGKPLELVEAARLAARIHELGANRVAVLAPTPPLPAVARWWIAPANPEAYAHDLYEFMHRMDASGAERLLVQRPPREPQWTALHDRLERAAAAFSGQFDDAD